MGHVAARVRRNGYWTSTSDLMQVRGYNGFGYGTIAAALRVTKASLHYHFPTKAELGRRLMERYRQNFVAALASIRPPNYGDLAIAGDNPPHFLDQYTD